MREGSAHSGSLQAVSQIWQAIIRIRLCALQLPNTIKTHACSRWQHTQQTTQARSPAWPALSNQAHCNSYTPIYCLTGMATAMACTSAAAVAGTCRATRTSQRAAAAFVPASAKRLASVAAISAAASLAPAARCAPRCAAAQSGPVTVRAEISCEWGFECEGPGMLPGISVHAGGCVRRQTAVRVAHPLALVV